MQSLPANIYSVASVREMDRIAIEQQGIPGSTLMQRAAAAAFEVSRREFPEAKHWQIVCGAGNNGGDGYRVAQLATQNGIVVSAVALVDPDRLEGDAASAHADFVADGGTVIPWPGTLDEQADLLVDAILGSGLQRAVTGNFAAAVHAINAHPAPVHTLDIATGINGDSGAVMACAVKADITTTFVGLKAGLFLGEGPNYCGRIRFAGLDIETGAAAAQEVLYRRIQSDLIRAHLPPRARGAHKGNFGHVLVIGGGPGMPGAVQLCGEAALRVGAGRVSVATHPEHAVTIASGRPELMCRGVAGGEELLPLLNSADVIAFGPGLGQSAWAQGLYEVLKSSELPAVWDADALNLLAKQPGRVAARIITPHPGEAATLLSRSSAEVQANRPEALARLQQASGGVVVLKGAGSLVSAENGVPWISTSGNPGMASPGMGDVLTGVIAGLLAQGLKLEDAAVVGVEMHAAAGDRVAADGERGMLASDLIVALRRMANP